MITKETVIWKISYRASLATRPGSNRGTSISPVLAVEVKRDEGVPPLLYYAAFFLQGRNMYVCYHRNQDLNTGQQRAAATNVTKAKAPNPVESFGRPAVTSGDQVTR